MSRNKEKVLLSRLRLNESMLRESCIFKLLYPPSLTDSPSLLHPEEDSRNTALLNAERSKLLFPELVPSPGGRQEDGAYGLSKRDDLPTEWKEVWERLIPKHVATKLDEQRAKSVGSHGPPEMWMRDNVVNDEESIHVLRKSLLRESDGSGRIGTALQHRARDSPQNLRHSRMGTSIPLAKRGGDSSDVLHFRRNVTGLDADNDDDEVDDDLGMEANGAPFDLPPVMRDISYRDGTKRRPSPPRTGTAMDVNNSAHFEKSKWRREGFHSQKSSTRADVVNLANGLEAIIKDSMHLQNRAERETFLDEAYKGVLEELIRQVSVECVERGQLLEQVFEVYQNRLQEIKHSRNDFQQLHEKLHSQHLLALDECSELKRQIKEISKVDTFGELRGTAHSLRIQVRNLLENLEKVKANEKTATENHKKLDRKHYKLLELTKNKAARSSHSLSRLDQLRSQLQDEMNGLDGDKDKLKDLFEGTTLEIENLKANAKALKDGASDPNKIDTSALGKIEDEDGHSQIVVLEEEKVNTDSSSSIAKVSVSLQCNLGSRISAQELLKMTSFSDMENKTELSTFQAANKVATISEKVGSLDLIQQTALINNFSVLSSRYKELEEDYRESRESLEFLEASFLDRSGESEESRIAVALIDSKKAMKEKEKEFEEKTNKMHETIRGLESMLEVVMEYQRENPSSEKSGAAGGAKSPAAAVRDDMLSLEPNAEGESDDGRSEESLEKIMSGILAHSRKVREELGDPEAIISQRQKGFAKSRSPKQRWKSLRIKLLAIGAWSRGSKDSGASSAGENQAHETEIKKSLDDDVVDPNLSNMITDILVPPTKQRNSPPTRKLSSAAATPGGENEVAEEGASPGSKHLSFKTAAQVCGTLTTAVSHKKSISDPKVMHALIGGEWDGNKEEVILFRPDSAFVKSCSECTKTPQWLIYSIRCLYEDKSINDTIQDRKSLPRQSFPQFIMAWATRHFELKSQVYSFCGQLYLAAEKFRHQYPEVDTFFSLLTESFSQAHLNMYLYCRKKLARISDIDRRGKDKVLLPVYVKLDIANVFVGEIFESSTVEDSADRTYDAIKASAVDSPEGKVIEGHRLLALLLNSYEGSLASFEKHLTELFREYDVSGDDRMQLSEFRAFARRFLPKWSSGEIAGLFNRACELDGASDSLSQNGFKRLLNSYDFLAATTTPKSSSRLPDLKQLPPEEMQNLMTAIGVCWKQFNLTFKDMKRDLERKYNHMWLTVLTDAENDFQKLFANGEGVEALDALRRILLLIYDFQLDYQAVSADIEVSDVPKELLKLREIVSSRHVTLSWTKGIERERVTDFLDDE